MSGLDRFEILGGGVMSVSRVFRASILAVAIAGIASAVSAQVGDLHVEIQQPAPDQILPSSQTTIEVEGGASIFGGVRHLDLMLVMDSSKSLRKTDKKDYRALSAIGLVRNLSPTSNIQVGLVDFDSHAELVIPLTHDREMLVNALRGLDQRGKTNIAEGIRVAMEEFDRRARPDSTRAMLLFTDGRSDEEAAVQAMEEARSHGIVIHTLLLGKDDKGAVMLGRVAEGSGGSFVPVADPAKRPEAFLNLRTTGVEEVTLRVGDSEPIPARLVGGTFHGQVPLQLGENLIVAKATSLDGRTREHIVKVVVRSPGCGELQIRALRDGKPALSLSDRSVEIVFDASNSMWGRLEGKPKISIAKETLQDALGALPSDLMLGLRVYGHQHPRERKNCEDSELLVPHSAGSRHRIREAIAKFRPRGQTPLGYSLERVAEDFGDFQGERAVVLVTDGIESCGGDPVAAARALRQQHNIAVHVIGFGLGSQDDEDEASLRAIAQASGGRYITARNAAELREALIVSVGTAFEVWQGDTPIASGALGNDEVIPLPAGNYVVRLDAKPAHEVPVAIASEESLTLVLERSGDQLIQDTRRRATAYQSCEGGIAGISPVVPVQPALAAPAPQPVPPVPIAATAVPSTPSLATVVTEARAPVPAAPALTLPEATAPPALNLPREAPQRARRENSLVIHGGSVEVWEDMRPDREPWVVIVRHPEMKKGSQAVWKGGDAATAEAVAKGVQHALSALAPPAGAPR